MTNVELDHHTEFASLAELEERVRRAGSAHGGAVVRDAPAGRRRAGGPRRAQPPATPAAALAALELAGVDRGPRPNRRSSRFAGTGRRFEVAARRAGVTVVDDYAPPPDRARGDDRGRARAYPGAAAASSSSSRTSTRARGTSPRELGEALAAADDVAVTDVYAARETPVDGVSGKLVVDALSDAAAAAAAWTPTRRARRVRTWRGARGRATSC